MLMITREKVKEAARNRDAVIVEVLDREHFDEFHLPGAINVPLDDDFDQRIRAVVPGKDERVIVYCDAGCEASSKAARRMDALGYEHVYRYERGKTDWKQAGLPIEN